MKANKLIWLFILFPFFAMAQVKDVSILYDEGGNFRIDPSLKISNDQYKIWQKSEQKILALFGSNIAENMKKEIAKNKFKPRNIISFHCDSTGISDIKMVKLIGKKDKGEMREQLTLKSKQIFKLLLSTRKRVFKDALSIDGDYYLSL